MRHLPIVLFLTCAQPEPVALAPAAPVLPGLQLLPDTLLYREHLAGRGAERTGNWWGRFDSDGCYTEAHNSWMWVTDPVLQGSSAWTLHWNGSPRLEPWFCLRPAQLARLREAARLSLPTAELGGVAGPVDRWTVVVDGRARSMVIPLGGAPGGFGPVVGTLAAIAAEGVWGQSPEAPEDSGLPATAFMP